jgi:hypothetical protein
MSFSLSLSLSHSLPLSAETGTLAKTKKSGGEICEQTSAVGKIAVESETSKMRSEGQLFPQVDSVNVARLEIRRIINNKDRFYFSSTTRHNSFTGHVPNMGTGRLKFLLVGGSLGQINVIF